MATRRAIISTLLRHEIPERMGLSEHFWPFIAENAWAKQGLQPGTDFVRRFDLDFRSVFWYSPPEPCPELAAVLEETEEWSVRRDGWGSVTKTWKARAGTPEHVGFTLDNPQIWFRDFRERILQADPATVVNSGKIAADTAASRADDRFTTWSFMFVFEWLRKVLGDVFMLESLMLEKEFIHDFNETFTTHLIAVFDHLFTTIGKPDGIHLYEDLGYTRSAFASPRCHCEMIQPYHKRMFGFFKEHGLPVIMHTCGDFRPHLPAIVEAGVDCIQAIEAKTGMNVVDLARDWKHKLTFMGNLDIRAYETGNREAIRAELLGKMEGMRALRAPYIVMSDHSIPPSVTLEDFEFHLDLYRTHNRY